MARLIEVSLGRRGVEVEALSDGDEAIRRCRSAAPDLLAVDLFLDGRDGLDVIRALRQDPSVEGLKIVLLLAKSTDREAFEGWAYRPDGFLVKPFPPADLLNVL